MRFQKGKIFPFGKEFVFLFQKNHPLSADAKFELSLCMLLVFCASRNIFNEKQQSYFEIFHQRFWKFTVKFFSVFFNSENCYQVLSSAHGCIYTSHSGKFHLDIWNKIADNNGIYCSSTPHEADFDITVRIRISKDWFCWTDIFIRWFEDYKLLYQFVRLT